MSKKYSYTEIKARVSPEQKELFLKKAGNYKGSDTLAKLIREFNKGNIKL